MVTLVADNNLNPNGYTGYVTIGGPVSNLQGLQNCANLSSLYLESNAITNLSPITSLTKLIALHLDYNNSLSDLSPVTNLTNLQTLEVRSGDVELGSRQCRNADRY